MALKMLENQLRPDAVWHGAQSRGGEYIEVAAGNETAKFGGLAKWRLLQMVDEIQTT